jgi:hypothetical protein
VFHIGEKRPRDDHRSNVTDKTSVCANVVYAPPSGWTRRVSIATSFFVCATSRSWKGADLTTWDAHVVNIEDWRNREP